MKTVPKITRNGKPGLSMDTGRIRNATSPPQRTFVEWGTVGHTDPVAGAPEGTPQFVRIEQGQAWVEVTMQPHGDQIVARLAMPGAGLQSGWYVGLEFGCRVVIEFVGGDPGSAVIVGRLNDLACSFPATVAGVQTGAAAATAPKVGVPAPTWQFIKTPAGQMLAIETGAGGDVLIHATTGSVEIKAAPGTGAIHLNGRCALGVGPTTPPVGGTVGPAGVPVPGVPAVPAVPVPATASIPVTPKTIVPYVGLQDGIVRAKDNVQSHIAIDPDFWAWVIAVSTHPLILAALSAAGLTAPIALHSEHSGTAGPGSQHTASD